MGRRVPVGVISVAAKSVVSQGCQVYIIVALFSCLTFLLRTLIVSCTYFFVCLQGGGVGGGGRKIIILPIILYMQYTNSSLSLLSVLLLLVLS